MKKLLLAGCLAAVALVGGMGVAAAVEQHRGMTEPTEHGRWYRGGRGRGGWGHGGGWQGGSGWHRGGASSSGQESSNRAGSWNGRHVNPDGRYAGGYSCR